MKILVIDDSPIHQDAARKQLAEEHDLTIVGSYDEGQTLLGYRSWQDRSDKHEFDVVLVDLLMPASRQMGAYSMEKELPVGIFLALLAAKNGAKHVALFTDSDHHTHPASACFDALNKSEGRPTPLTVEGASVLLVNDRNLIRDDESVPAKEVERERMDGSKYIEKVYPRIKMWDRLLKYLLNPPTENESSGSVV